jgi:uncharacterized protein YgiM (DUF1202 family)
MVTSGVSALNVHSSPSTGASVVGALYKGEKVVVLARSNGWIKVQLPNGSIGWVLASYTSAKGSATKSAGSTATTVKSTSVKRTVKKATSGVAVNVRRSPSLSAAIVTTIGGSTSYTVLGWSGNWVHVRLSDGTTGWISGTVVGALKASSSSSSSTAGVRRTSSSTKVSVQQYPHVVTASVRVHATPSLKGKVIGGASAGTRARILGYTNAFAHVDLSNGVHGYVYGSYVH